MFIGADRTNKSCENQDTTKRYSFFYFYGDMMR